MKGLRKLSPSQDYVNGVLMIGISVPDEDSGEYAVRIITSDRKAFWVDSKSLAENDLYLSQSPQPFFESRWTPAEVEKFITVDLRFPSLDETYRLLRDVLLLHISFQDPRHAPLLAVWILGTYMHQTFPAYPYIHLSGPTGSGKTKTAQIVQQLGFNGMLSANMSPSYIFRAVEAFRPTLCFDEVEDFENARDEASQDVTRLLNAGYKKDSRVGRVERIKNQEFRLVHMDCYSPKLLAGIAGVNSVLASRCIQIPTMMSSDEGIANKQIDSTDPSWQLARDAIYPTVLGNFGSVVEVMKILTEKQIIGRNWELWRPLLVIAKAISGDLYEELRGLALEMIEQQKELKAETSEDLHILFALERLTGRPSPSGYTTKEIREAIAYYYHTEYGKSPKQFDGNHGHWIGTRLRQLRIVTGRAVNRSVRGEKSKRYQFDHDTIKQRLKEYGIDQETEEALNKDASVNGNQETVETDVQRVARIMGGEIVS